MSDFGLPSGPVQLLGYFERVDREYPGEHWRRGAEMCRRWIELVAGEPCQADVDAFVSDLEGEPNPGSGWIDLGLQFRHWARGCGFSA